MFGGPYHIGMLAYLRHPWGGDCISFIIYDYTTRQFRVTMSTSNALNFYTYFGGGHLACPRMSALTSDAWNLIDVVITTHGRFRRRHHAVDGTSTAWKANVEEAPRLI